MLPKFETFVTTFSPIRCNAIYNSLFQPSDRIQLSNSFRVVTSDKLIRSSFDLSSCDMYQFGFVADKKDKIFRILIHQNVLDSNLSNMHSETIFQFGGSHNAMHDTL